MAAGENEHSAPDESVLSDGEAKDSNLSPFTFELLKITKEYQAQHGLRHGDYQRYRSYCSRRLARLRIVLQLPQGDRRHFKKRNVTESHVNDAKYDVRLLHIPLMLTERCWAYAMQLRQESNTEPRKRFHFIEKLRRACYYATMMDELAKVDRCDARTKLETQAYFAWIHGILQFELKLWRNASENLKKAQVIYETIMATLDEEERAPYQQRIDELQPNLRFCAYNVGDDEIDLLELSATGLLAEFDQLALQNKKKNVAVLRDVVWHDMEVPIRMDRVSQFLSAIGSLDASVGRAPTIQAKIKILEDMFIDLRDLIAEVRKDPKEQLVLNYLISIRIDRTVERNLLLIRITKKPQDVCRLMDINIQQTNEMMQLEPIHENAAAKERFGKRLAAFQTFRSFYVARTHVFFRRWKEAVATYELAMKQLDEIKDRSYQGLIREMMDEFAEKAETEHAVAHANALLERFEEEIMFHVPTKQFKSKKPLMERLGEFREDPQFLAKHANVVGQAVPMNLMLAKALYFDLALNWVHLQENTQNAATSSQGIRTAGISGFVKGFWNWNK